MIGAPFQHPFPPRRSRQEPGRRIVILRATNTHITPHIQARQTRRTGQKEDTTSRVVIEKPHVRPSARLVDLFVDGHKNRSLTTTTRPGGRSAPSERWRGCGRYVRTAWCCDGLTSATPSVDFSTPRSLCCSGGGSGLQTTRPNFRVAVLLKYRSNAHDVVEGTYADDTGPIGSLRKLLGGR